MNLHVVSQERDSPLGFREKGNMAIKLPGTRKHKENKAGKSVTKAVILIF